VCADIVSSLLKICSRAISMLVHIKDKQIAGGGCLAKASMAWCLLNKSQITQEFNPNLPTNYSYPLGVWMGTWPREQFFLIQVGLKVQNQMSVKGCCRLCISWAWKSSALGPPSTNNYLS
jgi:hypothetical protein